MSRNSTVHILLVEDDPDDIDIFSHTLKEITNKVILTTIQDGSVAVSMLTKNECIPDYIFLDLKLPGTDGLDVLKQIREQRSLKDVSVIIHSAVENPLIREKCWEIGIEQFINKSHNLSRLIAVLRSCIETHLTQN